MTKIILVGASILDNADKVGEEHCVKTLLEKKGYEVHNYAHRGLSAKDILDGGMDSNGKFHVPLEEIEELHKAKGSLKDYVIILQAGGGNDLLKGQVCIAPRVATVIDQLSQYTTKIIVNNRYPVWPDTPLHKIVNFYLSVTFECVWDGIMQEKKLVLANIKDHFPNRKDVLPDNLHLNKDAVQQQVELYHEVITSTKEWNKERTSFPERYPSGGVRFASRCCSGTGSLLMLLLFLVLWWFVPQARPALFTLLILVLLFVCLDWKPLCRRLMFRQKYQKDKKVCMEADCRVGTVRSPSE